jgi:uncharacterized peroxidase-related enzyme
VVHHGAALRRLSGDDRLVNNLASLKVQATSLGSADRALLEYAAKLTKAPSSISFDDVGSLKREGFDDRAIHDLCQVTAYYNFVNRIADGLGVELEDRFKP